MKHCGTQRLETQRLILRRFTPEDAEAMYRNWASDEEVTKYLTWPAHSGPEVSRFVLETWCASYDKDDFYQWAIALRETGEPIGSISAVRVTEDVSLVHIGYCIGRPWWHRGITSEALRAVIDFFFGRVGANRVEARHDTNNPRSGMVMRKCGMRYEGTLRSADRNNQGICDACCYALLRDEWQDRKTGGKRENDPAEAPAASRTEIVGRFYGQSDEDGRLRRTRHGQLEFLTTMHYIRRFAQPGSRVLEVGAGTGRYSVALAREGMDVTAVELLECNLARLRENARGTEHLTALQGDGTDLSRFADGSFDVTLVLGPMYHLYEKEEVHRAIDEAIRVTKPGGAILFAFLSVFGIMYANYFRGNWAFGQEENFTADHMVRHFKEQLFTGYDVTEFEALFDGKPVEWITTAGTDGQLEPIEEREDFSVTEEDFPAFASWYLAFAEKRELLGGTNHLLYICRKK